MNNILNNKALNLEIKDRYAKKDLWSIEEFIALILKQNPEYFSLTELKRHPKVKDLYDLVIRGIKSGKLRIIRNVYGSQLDSDKILKPLDGQVFAKEKDLPLDMEEEIRKYHVSDGEDLETKYQKLEAKYKESEIEKNKLLEKVKELEEDQLNKPTKKGYIHTLAIMAQINPELTSANFNANFISNKAVNFEFNFKVPNAETMRKYITPSREVLGYDRVYKNNKSSPKN